MSATIRDIVTDAQVLVGEVAGAGVETYSDDRMFADAIRGFNLIFKKNYWRQYCTWKQLTLDGTTGQVTTNDLAQVLDFEDFIEIRRDGTNQKISVLPRSQNPFAPNLTSGTTPRFWSSLNPGVDTVTIFENKRIFFLPKTATGLVNVFARFYPVANEAWDWSDTMYFDRDMLTYATAYMTLAGDGLNPDYADSCRTMMEGRYKDIRAALGSHEILGGVAVGGVPQNWTDQWGNMN